MATDTFHWFTRNEQKTVENIAKFGSLSYIDQIATWCFGGYWTYNNQQLPLYVSSANVFCMIVCMRVLLTAFRRMVWRNAVDAEPKWTGKMQSYSNWHTTAAHALQKNAIASEFILILWNESSGFAQWNIHKMKCLFLFSFCLCKKEKYLLLIRRIRRNARQASAHERGKETKVTNSIERVTWCL